MLFIDFVSERRRVCGSMAWRHIDEDDALVEAFPEAQFVVRVRATRSFPELSSLHPPDGARRALAFRPTSRTRHAGPGLEANRLGPRRTPQDGPDAAQLTSGIEVTTRER